MAATAVRARVLPAMLACLAGASGCAATPAPASAAAPAAETAREAPEIRLAIGQSAEATDAGLRIAFLGVEGDSRCARGETCVWEGSAAVRLSVSDDSGTRAFVLHTSARAGAGSVAHAGWTIHLAALEPHPVAGRPAAASAYVAVLRVERGTAGADAATQ